MRRLPLVFASTALAVLAACSDTAPPAAPTDDDATGLPIVRSWRAVYVLVATIFIAYVVILRILMKVYS